MPLGDWGGSSGTAAGQSQPDFPFLFIPGLVLHIYCFHIMSRLRQALQRVFGVTPTPGALRSRTIDTNFSIIKGNCVATPLRNVGLTKRAEGDRVIIHGKQPSLSKALKRGEKLQTARGAVDHESIIGKRVWDTVQARKGQYPHFSILGHDIDISVIYRPEHPS